MRRAASSLALVLASLPLAAGTQDRVAPSAKEAAVRVVVQKHVDSREANDPKAIEALFTDDADQLVSDRAWRRGRDELGKGRLGSSRRNPVKRSITVESVRLLSLDVALVDGRCVQQAAEGGKDRVMWTAMTLKRWPDGWRIAAIRNRLPTTPPPASAEIPSRIDLR